MIDVQQLMENLFDGSGIIEGEDGEFSKVVEHLEKAQLAQEAGVSIIVQLQMAEAVLAMEQVCAQTCGFDFEEVMNLLNVKSAVDQRVAETGQEPEDLGEDDLARIEQSLQQLYREDPQEAKYRASQIEDRFGYEIELEGPEKESTPAPPTQNEMPSQNESFQQEEDEDSSESDWYDQESGT